MADVQSDAVDDLKRRARRRLVGAVVLALAAAVILPLFLESDPQPLLKDVQIDIPPVDAGRYVSRLTPKEASQPPPAGGAVAPTTPPASAGPAKTPAAAAENAPVVAPNASAQTAATPAPSSVTNARETKSPEGSPSKAVAAKPAVAPAAAGSETFVVQLAAYAEPATAHALERKLKAIGFPAYTETFKTSHGALTRVRVGPFPSRDVADGARTKLKDAGQNGIVTPLR